MRTTKICELAVHASRHFTIHIRPDMYDFGHGREYRIGKKNNVSGEEMPCIAYSSAFKMKRETNNV